MREDAWLLALLFTMVGSCYAGASFHSYYSNEEACQVICSAQGMGCYSGNANNCICREGNTLHKVERKRVDSCSTAIEEE